MTRREAQALVEKTFATVDAENRIEAARRQVNAREVALEQWWLWFRAGKFSQARAWWFENVETN